MTIDELARTPQLLVALDFDGTLAPLVDEPMTARMLAPAAEAVAALQASPNTVVAFVSGRSLEDLMVISEHSASSTVILAGSHGAQWWFPETYAEHASHDGADERDEEDRRLRDELGAAAQSRVSGVEGAWIEHKAFGFGVHSRLVAADQAEQVHAAVDELVAEHAPHWRRREGHSITEYAFRSEGKDSAVARLREITGATGVLFAGDDVTDEDALSSLGDTDIGVRVGGGQSAATVHVADIAELAGLLLGLARQRTAQSQ